MQLLLTDRLTCPRCGPTFGLILLSNRLEARRVHDGVLGCPNCRDSFPIKAGFADLRAPPRGEISDGLAGGLPYDVAVARSTRDEEESGRLPAMLGIVRGPGTVALLGEAARHAQAVVRAVEDLQVVAIDSDVVGWTDTPGVSRAVAGPGLPFFSRMLRGVVVDGRLGPGWVDEAIRVVAPMSRVIVTRAPDWAATVLEEGGLAIMASEPETVVAARG